MPASTTFPALKTGPWPSRTVQEIRRLMNPSSVIQRRSHARSARNSAGSARTIACTNRRHFQREHGVPEYQCFVATVTRLRPQSPPCSGTVGRVYASGPAPARPGTERAGTPSGRA